MLFDTDVLIWAQRGQPRAAAAINAAAERHISVQTYLELLQGARDKRDQRFIRAYLADGAFTTLALTENIGHRAAVYMEEFALSAGLESGDAIIAATAVEHDLPLTSSNEKHFRIIKELRLRVFRPAAQT